ncbi:NepR family anti-sigma factor [soil metagenome]
MSIIDDSDSSRRKPSAAAGQAGLEEARLRQQAIGVKLRHLFDEVVNEPVPDEFLAILRGADEKKANDGKVGE